MPRSSEYFFTFLCISSVLWASSFTPVVVGGCIRKGKRYEMFAEELPKLPAEYGSDEDLIQDIMKITEKIVRRYPDQYLWLYKRGLYIPENATEEQRKRYPFYSVKPAAKFFSKLAPK